MNGEGIIRNQSGRIVSVTLTTITGGDEILLTRLCEIFKGEPGEITVTTLCGGVMTWKARETQNEGS